MTYLLLFATALLITLLLTPPLREVFRRMGWVDHPGERKIHSTPIPRLGGIPISIAFFCSILMLHWLPTTLGAHFRLHSGNVSRVFWPSLLVLMLGVYDDIRRARPWVKLLIQAIAAYWLYMLGLQISRVGIPGTGECVPGRAKPSSDSSGWSLSPMPLT